MAAGVGKTYRMLEEGRLDAEEGRDVVIGYLEAHGRPDTEAQAKGLELMPRREVGYRGRMLEEMDLPGVLARAPELCLIDELAHTNVPGTEHGKRYEDVEDVLDAGIDVFSTLNIQHLESLNDEIAELTGTRVRETIPDEVLAGAEGLVLVDLTPEALIERLQAGKIYPLSQVPLALAGFFKVENLAALRETALRQVAEDVEVRRLELPGAALARREEDEDGAAPAQQPRATSDRLLALVAPRPGAELVVRRAWRSAERRGGKLDILVVRRRAPAHQTRADSEQLTALRRLAAALGASLTVQEGEDVAAIAIDAARSLGSTCIVMGAPRRRRTLGPLRRLRPRGLLLERLLEQLPGVEVRIVADPRLRSEQAARER